MAVSQSFDTSPHHISVVKFEEGDLGQPCTRCGISLKHSHRCYLVLAGVYLGDLTLGQISRIRLSFLDAFESHARFDYLQLATLGLLQDFLLCCFVVTCGQNQTISFFEELVILLIH